MDADADLLRRPGAQVATGIVVGLLALVAAGPMRSTTAALANEAVAGLLAPFSPELRELDALDATTTVVDHDGKALAHIHGPEERAPVRLSKLPDHVVDAVLAAEDADFYEHGGLDLEAMARAVLRTAQGDMQGGSTITQQLVKLNYTRGERTLARKLREAVMALRVERDLSKDEILERYLNQVYFGTGAYGIGTAARTFFDQRAADLTVAQAALLAGKIRAPDALDPWDAPDAVRERRDQVLRAMAERGWLGDKHARRAAATPLAVRRHAAPADVHAPYFVELVKREALTLDALGPDVETRRRLVYGGGLRIETTLDLEASRAAQRAARAALDEPGDRSAAIVSVVPGDGAIRVLVGGLDFREQKFDVATQGHRQPGSAFKPFVYLGAIQAGIDPRSLLDGRSPRTFEYRGESFEVANYDQHSYGKLSIDDALVSSVNTAFMDLGLEVGPGQVVNVAHEAGIDADIGAYAAVSLGGLSEGVTPLEMAEAYATFATAGEHAEPYAIERIVDSSGAVIYAHEPEVEEALDPTEVGVLNRALRQVVQRGTGTAAATGHDVAGKTGTTSDHRDAWFVGYTTALATSVWVGHLDNQPMESGRYAGITGGSLPALLFRHTMVAALDGVDVAPLPVADPDDLALRLLTPTTDRSAPPTTSKHGEPGPGVEGTLPGKGGDTDPSPSTEPPPTTTSTTVPPPTSTTTTTTSPGGDPGG